MRLNQLILGRFARRSKPDAPLAIELVPACVCAALAGCT